MDATMKIIRKSGLLTADMNGEAVMMDITSGKYYNLGESGGRIWALLEDPMTLEEIVDTLLKEYAVEREVCRKEVADFLEELMKKGLATQA